MTINVHAALLPPGFEGLEPLVADWAISGSDARKRRRIASSEAERLAFYAAMGADVERALDHLDQFPVDDLDASHQRLMDLVLMLAHVALAVEKQGESESYHSISQAHFTITRATEDAARKHGHALQQRRP
ncbi:MAG: hypothetical protein ABW328_17770 [Ilumatobacteraceae bacterium]